MHSNELQKLTGHLGVFQVFALVSVLLASPSAQQTKKQLLKSMKTVYLFHITNEQKGEERTWFVDMKVRHCRSQGRRVACGKLTALPEQKKGRVGLLEGKEKAPYKPDVTIWVGDRDFVGLATGKVDLLQICTGRTRRLHSLSTDSSTLRSSMLPRSAPAFARPLLSPDSDLAYFHSAFVFAEISIKRSMSRSEPSSFSLPALWARLGDLS
jgi:hypothetical protein